MLIAIIIACILGFFGVMVFIAGLAKSARLGDEMVNRMEQERENDRNN